LSAESHVVNSANQKQQPQFFLTVHFYSISNTG
jgi:hypothetical protein